MKKILIVGGVAGGATAAARLRRLSEEDEIILFERDEYISFANCGLPYYIGDVIKDRNALFVQTAEAMSKRFNLDIRVFNEVIGINPKAKEVAVRRVKTGEVYVESFDALILSPGAKPIAPAIPGIKEANNVYTLRNIPDTDKIKAAVEGRPARAVVVGGGFIGVEMAENLRDLGIDVTLVEKLPQILKPLDFEMAQMLHREMKAHGVHLILGDGVDHFENKGRKIVLESGVALESDLTILAIGVAPENALAKDAGFRCGPRGHIVTTDTYEVIDDITGQPVSDIYAIGDAIEVTDFVDGTKTAIPLAGPANRQGRTVADRIHGIPFKNAGVQGTSVAKVFDKTFAATGNNAVQLKAKGLPFVEIHAHRGNHAGYYPNSSVISMKLLYDPETLKILGAQAVGKEGTEKRIDVIATVMRLGGTVFDLQELELSYAPPYSAAKDPVNILGYIAQNIQSGEYKTVQWHEIDAIIAAGGTLLDVRRPDEYAGGHVPGSVNIELDTLRDNPAGLPADKAAPLYVTCQVGLRGYLAAQILKTLGYKDIYNLVGGYNTYAAGHYTV
ncbi:MAG: FAD-dependent oxidoreductase [Eubacterium sp.]|nr:FAD-dependent oxidoreductase [Eubacterium sp.]